MSETCTCPRIPLCGFPEGVPPNPHTIRGWSGKCPEHAADAEANPTLWLWTGLPVLACRCELAEVGDG